MHDPDLTTKPSRLVAIIFLQMLPATLLTPAIRPLFATMHGGDEGAMHAFMALNMLGAVVAVPYLGVRADRSGGLRRALPALMVADAALLFVMTLPLATPLLLGLRTVEGVAHVGASSLLLAEAAAIGALARDRRVIAASGAAIMAAIALGSAIGGLAVALDARAPFWLGSCLIVIVAAVYRPNAAVVFEQPPGSLVGVLRSNHSLYVPLSAAFVERFAIGCLVVTFALYAHTAFGLSDRSIGLLFSLLTFPFALSVYPAGQLAARMSRAAVLMVGAVAFGVALLLLGVVPQALLAPLMVILGCASGLVFAPMLSYAASFSGEQHRATAMALVNAAGCLGMLLGPAVAGIVSALARNAEDPVSGYRTVFVVAACSVLAWLALSSRWLLSRVAAASERRAFVMTAHKN